MKISVEAIDIGWGLIFPTRFNGQHVLPSITFSWFPSRTGGSGSGIDQHLWTKVDDIDRYWLVVQYFSVDARRNRSILVGKSWWYRLMSIDRSFLTRCPWKSIDICGQKLITLIDIDCSFNISHSLSLEVDQYLWSKADDIDRYRLVVKYFLLVVIRFSWFPHSEGLAQLTDIQKSRAAISFARTHEGKDEQTDVLALLYAVGSLF